MSDHYNLTIEPLNPAHDRTGFYCGVDALDRYLKQQAMQDVKRSISRVYVAVKPDNNERVEGYYTLSSLSIEVNHLPVNVSKKLPKHHIPAALIGRLAVCQTAQGNGVGRMLLVDAVKRTLAISSEIAIYAIVVDAINEKAMRFYEQFGFSTLCDERLRMFLPLKSFA